MSIDATLVAAAAHELRLARSTRQPIAPISETFGIRDLASAYAVAELNATQRRSSGARVVGLKVGLTSAAVQRQLGVEHPDFGVLFDDMEFLDGQQLPAARLIQPKVEAEIALVVGADVASERPSWGEFLRSLAYALPALEVVDSAIADWRISLADTVADNASCGLYVLGSQPVDLGRVPLDRQTMRMCIDGAEVSSGTGAACLGHPLRAAYWLARIMAARGEPLRAGQVILSGALGPMAAVKAGDRVRADIGALGSVCCELI